MAGRSRVVGDGAACGGGVRTVGARDRLQGQGGVAAVRENVPTWSSDEANAISPYRDTRP
jgi:hypothetical protein